jgi:hypothetical protein
MSPLFDRHTNTTDGSSQNTLNIADICRIAEPKSTREDFSHFLTRMFTMFRATVPAAA